MKNACKRIATFLWILTFFFMTIGCAGLGKRLEPPRVSLIDIQVQEAKAFETVLDVELRVINPNDVPFKIKGIDCELEINGKPFAAGISNQQVEIPPYGTETVRVTFYSSVLDMLQSAFSLFRRAQKSGKIEKFVYKISGHIRLAGKSMMGSTVPFKAEGEFLLKQ